MIYRLLLLFFVMEYVRPTNIVPGLGVLRLNAIVPLAAVAFTLFSKGRVSNDVVLSDLNTKVVGGMMGLLLLSVLTADVTLYAYTMFTVVIGYAMIYWVMAKQITTIKECKGVFKVLIFVHVVVAALSPQMFTDSSSRTHGLASGSFLGDGNDFALSVNIVIPFCLFLLFSTTKLRNKVVAGASLLFLVVSVVATQSRGGTIALACVALYYWMKSDRKIAMGLVSVGLFGLVLAYAPSTYFDRMDTISNPEDGSAQGRIYAWRAGINMALDHPLLGVGSGHFAVAYRTKYRVMLDVPGQTAHSIYFLTLGELGFPGLAVLLTFIFGNLVANRRLANEVRRRSIAHPAESLNLLACLSASVIAFATGGAFLSAIYYPHLYVVAGISAAGRRLVREHAAVALPTSDRPKTIASPHPALARSLVRRRLS